MKRPRSVWPNLLLAAAMLAMLAVAHTASAQSPAAKANDADVRAATMLFYDAFNSALHGNLDPLTAVWSHRPDVTNLSADGGRATGWNEVHDQFQNMVRLYPSGQIQPKDILIVADGEMGYAVVNESGQLRSADGPMIKFNQRATNVFRLEDGKWKLVHRHADNSSTTQGVAR